MKGLGSRIEITDITMFCFYDVLKIIENNELFTFRKLTNFNFGIAG